MQQIIYHYIVNLGVSHVMRSINVRYF